MQLFHYHLVKASQYVKEELENKWEISKVPKLLAKDLNKIRKDKNKYN